MKEARLAREAWESRAGLDSELIRYNSFLTNQEWTCVVKTVAIRRTSTCLVRVAFLLTSGCNGLHIHYH
jgi:hypothetical protein